MRRIKLSVLLVVVLASGTAQAGALNGVLRRIGFGWSDGRHAKRSCTVPGPHDWSQPPVGGEQHYPHAPQPAEPPQAAVPFVPPASRPLQLQPQFSPGADVPVPAALQFPPPPPPPVTLQPEKSGPQPPIEGPTPAELQRVPAPVPLLEG